MKLNFVSCRTTCRPRTKVKLRLASYRVQDEETSWKYDRSSDDVQWSMTDGRQRKDCRNTCHSQHRRPFLYVHPDISTHISVITAVFQDYQCAPYASLTLSLLSASLYVSKRGAYWDRLCRDVVGWLVVTRMHCGQTVHPRPIVTMEH